MSLTRYSQSNNALGGDVTIGLVSGDEPGQVEALFQQLWTEIYSFERRFSRFLPGSELSQFNKSAGLKNQVSDEFISILRLAIDKSKATEGLYNPFILPALQKAGYIKSALGGYESDRQIKYLDRRVVGVEKVALGENWALIPYGTALDFGGIGKGYLADKLAAMIQAKRLDGFWVSLSGDIFAAGIDENRCPIRVGIQNANDLDSELNLIIKFVTAGYGVATSGTNQRVGQSGDWHHIIDPNTLEPAITDIKLATVVCDKAIDADILASTAIILGAKKAVKFLRGQGARAAVIQYVDDQQNIKIKSFGRLLVKSGREVELEPSYV